MGNSINYIYGRTTDGHNITLDGFRMEAFETFSDDNGEDCIRAFEDDGMERFIAALERLMTVREFLKFLKVENKR